MFTARSNHSHKTQYNKQITTKKKQKMEQKHDLGVYIFTDYIFQLLIIHYSGNV